MVCGEHLATWLKQKHFKIMFCIKFSKLQSIDNECPKIFKFLNYPELSKKWAKPEVSKMKIK